MINFFFEIHKPNKDGKFANLFQFVPSNIDIKSFKSLGKLLFVIGQKG